MKTDVLQFLKQLSEAQYRMIDVLQRKQVLLVRPDSDAFSAISIEEQRTVETMQSLIERREELLASARLQNINGSSIEALCGFLFPRNDDVSKRLIEAKGRTNQIRFLAFTNWTLSRKSLVHISQILEFIETNGQGKATYKPQDTGMNKSGGLIDKAA
ncbi:MAG: flagellar protein FlgN [Planctomycetaceae bacterium]|jgi:hypothetical protein|nr:flagellar protein FlgN [Planctomycetaceae bacterium]